MAISFRERDVSHTAAAREAGQVAGLAELRFRELPTTSVMNATAATFFQALFAKKLHVLGQMHRYLQHEASAVFRN